MNQRQVQSVQQLLAQQSYQSETQRQQQALESMMDDRTTQNNHELTADPPAPAKRTLFFDVYSPAALAVPVVKSPTTY
jgi:hypothetical protein